MKLLYLPLAITLLALKYLSRHRAKHGAEDIRKAIHVLELLLELEYAGA